MKLTKQKLEQLILETISETSSKGDKLRQIYNQVSGEGPDQALSLTSALIDTDQSILDFGKELAKPYLRYKPEILRLIKELYHDIIIFDPEDLDSGYVSYDGEQAISGDIHEAYSAGLSAMSSGVGVIIATITTGEIEIHEDLHYFENNAPKDSKDSIIEAEEAAKQAGDEIFLEKYGQETWFELTDYEIASKVFPERLFIPYPEDSDLDLVKLEQQVQQMRDYLLRYGAPFKMR